HLTVAAHPLLREAVQVVVLHCVPPDRRPQRRRNANSAAWGTTPFPQTKSRSLSSCRANPSSTPQSVGSGGGLVAYQTPAAPPSREDPSSPVHSVSVAHRGGQATPDSPSRDLSGPPLLPDCFRSCGHSVSVAGPEPVC